MNNAFPVRAPRPISTARMKGFSLVELMVVIGILAAIVALALPSYMEYTAKAKAADVLSQYDTLRKKAIIEANGKGINLCMTVKSSGAKSETDPEFVKLLNSIAPASPDNPYLTLKRVLSEAASDDGKALLLAVTAKDDAMQIAIARHLYRNIQGMGMVAPGAMVDETSSMVSFSAYLGEKACATKNLAATKKEAIKKLALVPGMRTVAQAGTAQQPAQPPAQVQTQAQAPSQGLSRIVDPRDDPGPKPADDAAKGLTCSGRICAFMADETPCPMEEVYLVNGSGYTLHPDPSTQNNYQKVWVAFGLVTIEDNVDGIRAVTKTCASYNQARTQWWDQTSDNNGGCMDIYRDELAPNGQPVTCYYAVPLIPGENARNVQKMEGSFPGAAIPDPATGEKNGVLAIFD